MIFAEEKITQITSDLESVALDWKTLRSVQECSCSAPFDHFTKKVSSPLEKFNPTMYLKL